MERPVDILVNNAGTIARAPAREHSDEDWDRVLQVNLSSQFVLTREVGRAMVERGTGKIIFTASLLSFQGGITVPGYTAAKSGIAGLTKALANEWAAHGVNVNAIAPGYIATDNTAALRADAERNAAILARIPAGRWGDADDIAGATVFLASGAADYVHGTVLAGRRRVAGPMNDVLADSPRLAWCQWWSSTTRPAAAGGLAAALIEGGLPTAEVTLRTPRALDAHPRTRRASWHARRRRHRPHRHQVGSAAAAGARYIVSPGFCKPSRRVRQARRAADTGRGHAHRDHGGPRRRSWDGEIFPCRSVGRCAHAQGADVPRLPTFVLCRRAASPRSPLATTCASPSVQLRWAAPGSRRAICSRGRLRRASPRAAAHAVPIVREER